jgi:integrase/recombinase XerD
MKAFLTWKAEREGDVTPEAPLFAGQRGPLTRNGVWRLVKGLLAAVGLDPRCATHTSVATTYATHLYRASGSDLEIVQEQLGHANVKTTTIYARMSRLGKVIKENGIRDE